MTKMKRAAVVAILLLAAACSKHANDKVATPLLPETLATEGKGGGGGESCTDPKNSANILDSLGIYHNLALDYVDAQAPTGAKTVANYVKYANDYMTAAFGSRVADMTSKLPSAAYVSGLLADSSTSYFTTIDNSSFTTAVKSKLKNFINMLKDTASLTDVDYCTVKSNIVAFENSIINDPRLSTTEKEQVLALTSVGRHSLYHWYQKYQGKLDGGETVTGKKRKWWQWLVIGIADVAGGIVGATAGAPTVVGIGAGAVAGAAGASSGAAAVVD